MKLHFPGNEVLQAIAQVESAVAVRSLYGATTGPGLWLVGDQGVYLMPNTAATQRAVVYARECDPNKLDFDTWWNNKRSSFGGDDGVEFIPLTQFGAPSRKILEATDLVIEIGPSGFTVYTDPGIAP